MCDENTRRRRRLVCLVSVHVFLEKGEACECLLVYVDCNAGVWSIRLDSFTLLLL